MNAQDSTDKIRVSRLNSVRDTRPRPYLLTTILKEITRGDSHVSSHPHYKTLSEMTTYARDVLLKDPNPEKHQDAYKALKESAPQFAPAAVLKTRSEVETLSVLACVEFDDPDVDTPDVLAHAAQDPHCTAAFRSLSGKPKLLIYLSHTSIDQEPLTTENFRFAWAAAARGYQEFGEADFGASKVTQLQALVFDPNIHINETPQPLAWGIDEETFVDEWETQYASGKHAEITALANLPIEYQEEIKRIDAAGEWKDNGWSKKPVPCPFGGDHEHDGWDRKSNGTHIRKNADNDLTFHCFKCPQSIRYTDTPRHKRVKLQKTDSQLILETLERSRAFLAEVFESNAKVFGLRADTGVGKNEAAIQHVYKGIKLLLNMPHKNLMNELAARFNKAEIPPFAYRGITSNTDGAFPHESPCIQPVKYDTYSRKGGNPRDVICPRCPVRGVCEQSGHWHDLRQLKKHQVNLFTFPQLFTNPIFRGWIQSNIGSLEKDDMILHDDTEITALFNISEVSRDYLENVSRLHHGTNTGSFADMMLSLLHKDNLYENLHTLLFEKITESERYEIIEGLSSVRIDGKLMTLDDAVERGHFKVDTQAEINALPAVADSAWTLLHQLELFFDMYPYADNAPIRYSEGVLSFAIAPILPKTKARIGFMGATLQEEHLKRAFPESYYPNVMYFDTTSTEWHPDARVYQLATNKNPRRTVLTDGTLNATGQAYWQSVMDIVHRLDGTHAVITYKSVIDEKQDDIEQHNLITAHFGGLTGLDTLFEDIDYLHILFSPERPPFALEWDAKMIYGADAGVLCFDRDAAGEFTDTRVQSVYEAGVIAELIQALGRARLVNFGRKVFLWCSHALPTITDRDQTHLFTERDIGLWQSADTETFETIIAQQAERTPTNIAEEEGITEGQARRRTKKQRKQTKADKKARAKELDDQNAPVAQIIAELDISRRTFYNWKDTHFA